MRETEQRRNCPFAWSYGQCTDFCAVSLSFCSFWSVGFLSTIFSLNILDRCPCLPHRSFSRCQHHRNGCSSLILLRHLLLWQRKRQSYPLSLVVGRNAEKLQTLQEVYASPLAVVTSTKAKLEGTGNRAMGDGRWAMKEGEQQEEGPTFRILQLKFEPSTSASSSSSFSPSAPKTQELVRFRKEVKAMTGNRCTVNPLFSFLLDSN